MELMTKAERLELGKVVRLRAKVAKDDLEAQGRRMGPIQRYSRVIRARARFARRHVFPMHTYCCNPPCKHTVDVMNDTAKTRPCMACRKHYIGVADGLCPDCEKDSAFYQLSRKKGDKRDFIPYPELFQQWKNRRAECREWRKLAEQAAEKWAAVAQSERERSYLLAILNALNADLDPALALAAELDKTRAELAREQTLVEFWREQAAGMKTPWEKNAERLLKGLSAGAIPLEQWRRLVQLAPPDKHGDSPASTEATRWLMENRP